MKAFKWLRPEPEVVTRVETEVQYVVDPHMGKRQLEKIRRSIDKSKYKVGDTLESVAYRQGQQDVLDFIEKQIIGGKL